MPPRKPSKVSGSSTNEATRPRFDKTEKPADEFDIVKGYVKFRNFMKDERTRIILGLLVLGSVVYLSFALISYFFTGAADQSKIDLSFQEMNESRIEIHNWTSVIGAVIAEYLINKWFGVSSLVLMYFITVVGLNLLNVKWVAVSKAFFQTSFWLIWTSIALGFALNPFVKEFLFFAPGGLHGEYVAQYINSYVGIPGTIMIVVGSLVFYLILTSKAVTSWIRNLFSRKDRDSQTEPSAEDFFKEASVAVGTEIVPEEWVSQPEDEEVMMTIEMPEENSDECSEDNPTEDHLNENLYQEPVNVPDIPFEINVANQEDDFVPAETDRYDPTLDLSNYKYPTLDLLKVYGDKRNTKDVSVEQNANKDKITTTLLHYGIEIQKIHATVGPTITLYEIVPKAGVRISKIRNLEYDIMLSLAATGIRIIAPIPGKGTIGIEVPNADPQIVSMQSVIASRKFQESKFDLPIVFGRTITNEEFMVDLAKMPHLLVAGATGQGKSVGLNAIITSLLYKKHPSQLKFVLVDPKKVEFNIYSDIEKHFLAKLPDGEDAIITDTSKVVETLNSLCKEMDDRYDLLKQAHVRNIKEYNEKFFDRRLNPEKGHRFLPYIVVIVDEFGDLIMTAGKEVEMPIARIAQLARAVGIHMILATQRPSVNIITGVIKANFPARVAFRVSSMIDSRTILDAPGANQLVGRGDMLFSQGNDLIRVQCAFVDTPEVESIVHFIGDQQGYPTAFYLPEYVGEGSALDVSSVDMSKRDPLFEEAARLIVANQQGSTSLIQRKFSIGYNRAGRIVDQLEVAGIVGPFEGSKARQVLVMDDYHLEQILKQL